MRFGWVCASSVIMLGWAAMRALCVLLLVTL